MIVKFLRLIVVALFLLPAMAAAEPIKLKLSLFTSDRSLVYAAAIKPFVDAVNSEGKGLIEIEVYFSGALGKGQAKQPGLVADGVADIAFIVPGQNPERFHDEMVIELPGLFRDTREATLVYSRLIAAHALDGYNDFFVIGAFASSNPCCINTRKPVTSLADLKGLKIRANNLSEASTLEALGALPVLIAANQTFDAISSGKIDGAPLPPSVMLEFGLGRVATNHFVLLTTAAPLALVMNRSKFDSLPDAAKAIIRKYSGEWEAAQWFEALQAAESKIFEQIKADPARKIVFPSASDLTTVQQIYKGMVNDWAARSGRNRALLERVENELALMRSSR